MKRSFVVAISFTLVLFALLLIPLDGKVDNTFCFFLEGFTLLYFTYLLEH